MDRRLPVNHRTLVACLLALAALLSTPALRAQVGEQRYNLSLGFNAGMTLSSISLSPTIRQGTLKGMTGGVMLRYITERYFRMICGAQLEVNYVQRGWCEAYEDYPTLSYERTMNYVEIPLMAHMAFGKERGFQVFIHLGPQVAFFLSDSYTMRDKDEWDSYSLNTDQHSQVVEQKFDYGLAGGAGMELRTKIGHFQLEGRYYYGLSDFFRCTKKDDFSRAAHSVITVRIGYLFDLTK